MATKSSSSTAKRKPAKKAAKKKTTSKKTTSKKAAGTTVFSQMEKELKRIEKQIDSLKLKKKVDAKLKSTYDKTMKTLKEQRKIADKKLREAKSAWREISKGFDAAWKQLSTSVTKAQKKFK